MIWTSALASSAVTSSTFSACDGDDVWFDSVATVSFDATLDVEATLSLDEAPSGNVVIGSFDEVDGVASDGSLVVTSSIANWVANGSEHCTILIAVSH
jgi:hypothetical protein